MKKCTCILFMVFFLVPASAMSMPLAYSFSGVVTSLTSLNGFTAGVYVGDEVHLDLFYNYDESISNVYGSIDPNGSWYYCTFSDHIIDIHPIAIFWYDDYLMFHNGGWANDVNNEYHYEDLEIVMNIPTPTSGFRMPTPAELDMATMVLYHTSIWGYSDPVNDHAIVLAELRPLTNPVPEPGTWLLLATGLVFLRSKGRKYLQH